MNSVQLIGRLTRDPELRYTASQTATTNMTIAVDRLRGSQGEENSADYPRVVCFGKTAEIVSQWAYKGMRVGVEGRLQTGLYKDKDGKTVFTTDVVANRVEFLEKKEHAGGWSGGQEPKAAQELHQSRPYPQPEKQMNMTEMPANFEQIKEDVPF